MAIPEAQLSTWTAQGSVQQSAATYQTIRTALNDSQSPYYPKNFEIFLQGSYGNDTNIYADSDVDVVIRLDSVYYSDTSHLSADDKTNYDRNFTKADYSLAKFKEEVGAWLLSKVGKSVKPGNKAIFVPGSGNRRDADVLPCALHRAYYTYPASGAPAMWEGVVFWTGEGTKIVNYPKQHSENCTKKHQATGNRLKPAVRMFKNMRNKMIEEGFLQKGVAPSYYLEGLLTNAPDYCFSGSLQETFNQCMNSLRQAERDKLMCANGIHFLVRDGQQVCWSVANFTAFMAAVQKFWDDGGKRKGLWL
ncbi:nucleotidyltransferase [Mesorhizobium sp. M1307]|uniref:nucleotidyltransferase domain-containing protein n=1 Tax=Mesorhizobium sp. M1307 TaxID=2957079 RepID=UPI003339C257